MAVIVAAITAASGGARPIRTRRRGGVLARVEQDARPSPGSSRGASGGPQRQLDSRSVRTWINRPLPHPTVVSWEGSAVSAKLETAPRTAGSLSSGHSSADRIMAYPIILHHFDASPFSEKIRAIFGFKGISWQSVRIPRIMPKPDLMPLTGGYRRTPVMQIGADVFCDTQIIIREIERRFPSPTLFPSGHAGVPWALALWTDRTLFQNTVNLVFGTLGQRSPRNLSRIAAGSAGPASTSRGCGRRFRRCAISFAPILAGSRRSSATGGHGSSGISASPTSAPT